MDYLKAEGLNVNFVIKNCNKDKKLLPGFISEVKKNKPDLVYTFGKSVTSAVAGLNDNVSVDKNVTNIPIQNKFCIINVVAS